MELTPGDALQALHAIASAAPSASLARCFTPALLRLAYTAVGGASAGRPASGDARWVASPHMAKTAWSMAKLCLSDHPLLSAIASAALRKRGVATTSDLVNLAWACATRDFSDCNLLAALSEAVRDKLSHLDSRGLANTAWAFAQLNVLNGPLLDAISAAALTICE